jgi:ribosomal protein S18 acetylase RimI-like enzyme
METVCKIRRLTQLDEPFLWEMLYYALYVPKGQPPLPRETIHESKIRRYVENWGLPDDVGYIATDGDIPVGAAWLRKFSEENKGFGYIDNMTPEISVALLPEYRGKGIGSALLNQLFELTKERYASVSLSVSQENPSRRLYERMGFQIVKQEGDSLTMLKYLNKKKNLI